MNRRQKGATLPLEQCRPSSRPQGARAASFSALASREQSDGLGCRPVGVDYVILSFSQP